MFASILQISYIYLQLHFALRYVGVIWFVFHVIQLLLIIFTQQNLLHMEIYNEVSTKSDSKSDLHKLVMVILSACLLITYMNT